MTIDEHDRVIYSMTATLLKTERTRHGDFMATVKLTPQKKLETEYRFRWHKTAHKVAMDGGPDDDEKSFFALAPIDDSPEAREKLMKAFRSIATASAFTKVHEEIGEWTGEQFMTEVLPRSGMRMQSTVEEPK